MNVWCWLFMALAVGFYILFQGYPIICSIQYSLLNWSGMTGYAEYVGLANYKELLHDELFWNAFFNSFKYTALIVPLELAVSLFLAYMLNNEKLKGSSIYRTMYFVPVVTTTSVVGIIMIFILGVQGPVNHLLTSLHLSGQPVNFLGNAKIRASHAGGHFPVEGLRHLYDILAGRAAECFQGCLRGGHGGWREQETDIFPYCVAADYAGGRDYSHPVRD